VKQDTRQAVYV